jgi:hypothetical protein
MLRKRTLFGTVIYLATAIGGPAFLQPLYAQSAADEKCQGSTVDDLGDARTAKVSRAFLAELQAAVKANDKDKIAGMISYPLNFIHDGKRARIREKQTFLARYDDIFSDRIRTAILQQSSHCLFGNANGEMIGRGEVWFSEMQDGTVKIITVNGSAGT